MAEQDPRGGNGHGSGDDDGPAPIRGLQDLQVDLGADLESRVRRDINRRTLAADSLDFSFTVMFGTFWEHLRSVIESWPGARPPDDGREAGPDE